MWTERKLESQPQRERDHRSPYQRDKARILHSAAFRRLQSKTQVLGVGMSDFYRTRLTHSLEASQIGQGIAAQLRIKYPQQVEQLALDDQLIEALCLAHDIGHPPYGHGGEVALNAMMSRYGGFEGNGQTFRIITKLEPYTEQDGMNLTRRTLLGLVKYPNFIDTLYNAEYPPHAQAVSDHRRVKASDWHPPKGLYRCDQALFDWMLAPLSNADKEQLMSIKLLPGRHAKTRFKSFDCSIMELADDIAYGIHDLEDAIVMGIIHRDAFIHDVVDVLAKIDGYTPFMPLTAMADELFHGAHHKRKNIIGGLVNSFITAIEIVQVDADFEAPLLQYNAQLPDPHAKALTAFKLFVLKHVIRKPEIQVLEYKGQQVVMALFEAFSSDPERLLPHNTRERWHKEQQNDNGMRVIADYIAGMTDGFAARLHANLFAPRAGSLGDSQGQI
ncbi:deoxyguanosinetriphosphate triphosphohydrolase family protein [Aestuariibacter halophilus]|uniref:Deoxyguanosinetriphosphate triphosphohydrolase-like protein n=1 Tax=Fluctibacter halophilus TaxID=226011 RepID=A0ABS8G8X5_9ALTE|nr:anti-phage deoxyguanosine triphosphatase [Aestuariibacter halophilus]MCC2615646.1 deoxyguanosinetriphosphate triphosphohydrolase family protein [Aestuariibacter halophilus]